MLDLSDWTTAISSKKQKNTVSCIYITEINTWSTTNLQTGRKFHTVCCCQTVLIESLCRWVVYRRLHESLDLCHSVYRRIVLYCTSIHHHQPIITIGRLTVKWLGC